MASKSNLQSLLTKASRLRHSKEIWEFASPLAWVWVTPRQRAPYRPYLFIVVNTTGKALLSQTQEHPPDTDEMLATLLQAMVRPGLGAGRPRRPKAVHLDDADQVSALAPSLAQLDIRCEYRAQLPTLNQTRRFLERGFMAGDPWPVANERAYPVFGRTTSDGLIDLPTKADLLWLEAGLSGFLEYLPQFLQREFDDDDPENLVLSAQTISGETKLKLQMPELDDLFRA
ncbi:hypothetical protein XM38_021370 [Halomicronema hongdechloris C2206]|uniref:DUF6930 domain-containing protein n=1 Tax=Halomicronema hongdechloris C2206 TaxID=1641165 RepID=A0A1Z3HLM3_9CYAN|nr:hypothetical protein [Halomicronema hongdechloris]ASC71185.1 hypothetical protein XM38_021370 [Halomicronema hongdechloris C2206]